MPVASGQAMPVYLFLLAGNDLHGNEHIESVVDAPPNVLLVVLGSSRRAYGSSDALQHVLCATNAVDAVVCIYAQFCVSFQRQNDPGEAALVNLKQLLGAFWSPWSSRPKGPGAFVS